MTKYVDGFVLIVPKDQTEEYKKMAEMGRDAWMKHGAIGYYECRAADMKQNEMGGEKTRAFPEMAGASDTEEVWFSFIIFESEEDRNRINAEVAAEMNEQMKDFDDMKMPVDMTRMAYGGFQVEVEG